MRAVGALSWVLGIVFDTYGGGVKFTLCCGYRFRYLRVDKTVECGEPLLLCAGYRFRYPTLYCGLFGLFEDKKIRPEISERIFCCLIVLVIVEQP